MFDERGRTSGTLPRIRMGPKGFWREAFNWSQTTTIGLVVVLAFAALYAAVDVALFRDYFHSESRPQDPFLSSLIQVMTTVVGFLMVLRLNVGYQRWWEARTLWGGIINQSRNLAITILAHGPKDNEWRERAVRWVACFGHVARGSLRRFWSERSRGFNKVYNRHQS